MGYEKCESKVANLLASLENLPRSDVNARFKVLEAVLALQEKEIQELKKAIAAYPDPLFEIPKAGKGVV